LNERLIQLINEAIKVESNAAELYSIFHKAFPEDCPFWYQLHMEEENHASIIRSARETWLSGREFPLELLPSSLDDLLELNGKLASLIEEYKDNPPSRETAFNVALELEESAGEAHLQKVMERPPTSTLMELFQILTGDDKKHASRIHAYMRDKGIKVHRKRKK
jgi:ferritin